MARCEIGDLRQHGLVLCCVDVDETVWVGVSGVAVVVCRVGELAVVEAGGKFDASRGQSGHREDRSRSVLDTEDGLM